MPAVEVERFPTWTERHAPGLGGRDFLGLQSVGDGMLERLLPGMTNQTRHPRYYAFFTWLFEHAHKTNVKLADLERFRFKAESALLFSAASRHGREFRGLVGIQGVTRGKHAWDGTSQEYSLELSSWTRRASAYSAPFYSPSFQQLGLIQRGSNGEVGVLPRGREVAGAFAAGLTKAKAITALLDSSAKRVDGRKLAELHDDLCPCVVRPAERAVLREMFFRTASKSTRSDGDESRRRLTLAFILDLVGQGDYPSEDDELRTLLYFWQYRGGVRYRPERTLEDVASGWRLFQARQYQRYAVESLWTSFLRMLRAGAAVGSDPAPVAREIVGRLETGDLLDVAGVKSSQASRLSLSELATRLSDGDAPGTFGPNDNRWKGALPKAPTSESSWKERIDHYLWDEPDDAAAFGSAIGLLLRLWTRWDGAEEPTFGKGFLSAGGRTRISLRSMFRDFERLRDMPLHEFCSFVLTEYVIGQHLRVSSHKLRIEGIDTFWFYADEDGYRVHPERDVERAKPGYNAPKLRAATSSLYDLGLLKRRADGVLACSADGERMLKTVVGMEIN